MEVSKMMTHFICCIYFLLIGNFQICALHLRGKAKTKIRRTCMDSEMEIFSSHGVKIEPYYKSHVELHLLDFQLNHRKRFDIKFDFKTTQPDGVLFYGRSRSHDGELLALTLNAGHLSYKVRCPTLHADLLIPTKNLTRLDDGRWHTVKYSVKTRPYNRYGVIVIDGHMSSKKYEVSCEHITSLVIGGHSEKDRPFVDELEQIPGHFDGCIRNMILPSVLRTPPKYYAVSICQ